MRREEVIWKEMYRLFDKMRTIMDDRFEIKNLDIKQIDYSDIAYIKDFLTDNLDNIFKTTTNE